MEGFESKGTKSSLQHRSNGVQGVLQKSLIGANIIIARRQRRQGRGETQLQTKDDTTGESTRSQIKDLISRILCCFGYYILNGHPLRKMQSICSIYASTVLKSTNCAT